MKITGVFKRHLLFVIFFVALVLVGSPAISAAYRNGGAGTVSSGRAKPDTLKKYTLKLSGPNESPPNGSPGTGSGNVGIDTVAQTMAVDVSFIGLTGTTTAAHIHCCTTVPGTGTAIVATTTPSFPGFPFGVTSGHYSQTFDMTQTGSYNSTFITNNGGSTATAFTALVAGMDSGSAYFNIHTVTIPGGEIRGFLGVLWQLYLPLIVR